jgi:hypothetical protein
MIIARPRIRDQQLKRAESATMNDTAITLRLSRQNMLFFLLLPFGHEVSALEELIFREFIGNSAKYSGGSY